MGLVIDSSGSITPSDYSKVRQFVSQLANRLQISEAGTHMAILLYSFEAHVWHRYIQQKRNPYSYLKYFACTRDNSLVYHEKILSKSEIRLRPASMLFS